MHEVSIAERIIEVVSEEARRRGARKVSEVTIRVGVAALVDVEALLFALKFLSTGTILEGASFKVRSSPLVLKCVDCGEEWRIESVSGDTYAHIMPEEFYKALTCPKCGSNNVEIIDGTDIIVEAITLEFGNGE